jgi:predicted DNA-binding protein YlxM (UPF0122 family)
MSDELAQLIKRPDNLHLTDKSTPRSQAYQYKLLEICFDPSDTKFENFIDEALDHQILEEIHDIKIQLVTYVWSKIKSILTPKQYTYYLYHLTTHMTQTELARFLNVSQSTVNKTIRGSHVRDNGRWVRKGGIEKKIYEHFKNDPIVKAYKDQISDLYKDLYES